MGIGKYISKYKGWLIGCAVLVVIAVGLFAVFADNNIRPADEAVMMAAGDRPNNEADNKADAKADNMPGKKPDKEPDASASSAPLTEIILGDISAPVKVVEYASLTCGHCGDFHNNTLPIIKRDYIDTGKISFHIRPFPLDSFATAGAMLVQCLPAHQRAGFTDILYAQQARWTRAADPSESLRNYARQAGMSAEAFSMCLRNQDILDSIREIQRVASGDLGVDSTPTFFVNDEKVVGNVPLAEFRQILDKYVDEGG